MNQQDDFSFEAAIGLPSRSNETGTGAVSPQLSLELAALTNYPRFVGDLIREFTHNQGSVEIAMEFPSSDEAHASRLRLYNAFRYIDRHRDEFPASYLCTSRIKLAVKASKTSSGCAVVAYTEQQRAWPEPLSMTVHKRGE